MSMTPQRQPTDAEDPRIYLALKRTELAWDRTLLAWLRTTSALVVAGFAFDKGTQLLHQSRLATGTALVRSGHFVGLSLTAASTLLLVFVCYQYLRDMRELARVKGSRPPLLTPALIANALLIVLSTILFVVLLPSST